MDLRVLHIIWNAKYGGIENLVFDLIIAQKESNRVTPSLLVVKKEGELLEQFERTDFQLYFLNFTKGIDLRASKLKSALAIFNEYDILHFHFFNPILLLLAKYSSKRIVFTEHGNFGFGREIKLRDRLMQKFKAMALNNNSIYITFNSKFSRKLAEQMYIKPNRENTSVVYNGIDFSMSQELLNKSERTPSITHLKEMLRGNLVIGTASRFAEVKRIDRLIKAFASLEGKENIKLLLVGSGPKLEDFKKQVKNLGIAEKVIFTGYLKEVRQAQELMDICVLPSQNEAFGLVAIETLSIGKPTLVFRDGGGLVEIIEVVNSNDVVNDELALVERLKTYMQSAEVRNNQKEERIKRSHEFTIEKMEASFTRIYQKN